MSAEAVATDFPEASINPELIERCVRICRDYRVSARELQLEWDMLTLNSKGPKKMSLDALGDLEDVLAHHHQAKRAKQELRQQFSSNSTPDTYLKESARVHGPGRLLSGTPVLQRLIPGTGSAVTSSPFEYSASPRGMFAERNDSGKVVCTFGASDRASTDGMDMAQLDVATDGIECELYESMMWEKMEDRALTLDARVLAWEEALRETAGLPPFASVVATGADEVTVVGRVCCESEGKLNAQSVFLEGSRASSGACRVRLDLSSCPEYALFPGQVVAAIGVNPMGHTFMAHTILQALPAANDAQMRAEMTRPVTFMVAAGPYSTSDDLSYAPLSVLLAKALEVRPDALVLIGPFVDDQHPKLAANLAVTYEQVFEQQVVARITGFIEKCLEQTVEPKGMLNREEGDEERAKGLKSVAGSQHVPHVVLIPSTRDLIHQPVFPQPPLTPPSELPERARPFYQWHTNPSVFTVGGVRVAASSVDVLMMLGQQELARIPIPPPSAPKPDRMARLASHLLQQRHLLPLFPTPHEERSPLAVDVVASGKAACLQALPDVLLCPSELTPFAKLAYGGTIAVNPGRLTRKQGGGNYATICVRPPPSRSTPATDAATLDVAMALTLEATCTPSIAAQGNQESAEAGKRTSAMAQGLVGEVAPIALPPQTLDERVHVEVRRI